MVIHAPAPTRTVTLTIDGAAVTVPEGTTIWAAAKQAGIEIPVLCHDERYDPVGVCRMCVVDVGARAYAAACVRPCEDGMEVKTATPDVERSRATLTELLLSDQPAAGQDPKQTTTADNELLVLAEHFGLSGEVQRDGGPALPDGPGRGADLSNPVIAVNHDACILCDRCVRACDDIQGNDVIGRSGKGYSTRIAFDLDDPMGASSCVTCGECVAACPTGALTNKPIRNIPIRPRSELEQVDSVCPYCGVGCALTYHVDRERGAIAFAEGRDQPGSKSRLCVKGRYGWDYAASPQRLTVPLIRRDEAYPKGALSADVRGEMNRGEYLEDTEPRAERRRLSAGHDVNATRRGGNGSGRAMAVLARAATVTAAATATAGAATVTAAATASAGAAGRAGWSTMTRCCRTSARPPGTRRWTWWPDGSARSSRRAGPARSPDSARPSAPTRRRTSSRS